MPILCEMGEAVTMLCMANRVDFSLATYGSQKAAMAKNVLGSDLQPCSTDPMTGFFRDGCCNTGAEDSGLHVVCAVMSAEFLEFSRRRGNDLTTPNAAYRFPGLKPGDRWCLCAVRWKEAYDAGMAPGVVLESTHISTLEFASIEELREHAAPA